MSDQPGRLKRYRASADRATRVIDAMPTHRTRMWAIRAYGLLKQKPTCEVCDDPAVCAYVGGWAYWCLDHQPGDEALDEIRFLTFADWVWRWTDE